MRSITFYSYKGGTGRTLAAINFAIYLSRLGLRTIILDMDLEAPGVDSKFPGFSIPSNQRGVLDYILDFQSTGKDPGSVKDLYVDIPISTQQLKCSVGLIPSGCYQSAHYSAKLNALNWGDMFSDQGNGAAFFQQFLARIKSELKPDYLIIDSRTGIGEISGICTQQLADEVVMLSSLAGESVKMTRQLAGVIAKSEIAASLGKRIDVKVVIARIPKTDETNALKSKYSNQFGVPEKQLFFLFSSPALEQSEFIALLGTQRDEELVSSYIRLFHGLNVELADESIRKQIAITEASLLSVSPSESEARILELTALYPHPEIYRAAMRYYRLARKQEGVYLQGLRLLEVKPDDEEAQDLVVESFLNERPPLGTYGFRNRQSHRSRDYGHMIEIGWSVFKRKRLHPVQLISLAAFYEEAGELLRAHEIAMASLSEKGATEWTSHAYGIAARTAIKSGMTDVGRELLAKIPAEQLRGPLAEFAIKTMAEADNPSGAFELATTVLQQDVTMSLVAIAAELASKLDRKADLVAALVNSRDIDYLVGSPELQDSLSRLGLDEVLRLLPESRMGRRRVR